MRFFFFQAEDGIRDADVTGVQTCALPIWPSTDTTPDCTACSSRRTRPTGRNTQQMSNAMKLTMPRFDAAPVLVVGDVMLDRYWHGPSERISPERSEEHTSELQSRPHLVCRLLLEKKKQNK